MRRLVLLFLFEVSLYITLTTALATAPSGTEGNQTRMVKKTKANLYLTGEVQVGRNYETKTTTQMGPFKPREQEENVKAGGPISTETAGRRE